MAGRRMAFFPLPAFAEVGLMEDHYVDLRLIAPVRFAMVSGSRQAALSAVARSALQAHYFKFVTAKTWARNVECSQCGTKLSPEKWLIDLHE